MTVKGIGEGLVIFNWLDGVVAVVSFVEKHSLRALVAILSFSSYPLEVGKVQTRYQTVIVAN
jgi:hypothetical protein